MALPRLARVSCLLLVFGCASASAPPNPQGLKGRLNAALAMTNFNERDDALKAIAEDAAALGETETLKQALEKFSNTNNKDDVAAAAALKLSAAGHTQDAVDVAKMMFNSNSRDDVLRKIAQAKQ